MMTSYHDISQLCCNVTSRSLRTGVLTAIILAVLVVFAGCEKTAPQNQAVSNSSIKNETSPNPSKEDMALIDPPIILALGDSITAGYGVEEAASWPTLLQAKLIEEGRPHRVINAGISGDTTAGGLARMDWLMRQPVAMIIVELGGNDGLRGQSPQNTRQNLAKIIEKGIASGAQVVIAGMKMPANLGQEYLAKFNANYPDLAQEYDLPLIPFILEGVAGHRDLTLPDGIHPNAAGYRIVLDNIWDVIEPLLVQD